MNVRLHPHAKQRMLDRGATETMIIPAVQGGSSFPAKYGRTGFRRVFAYDTAWRGRQYANVKLEAIAVQDAGDWLVLTVIVKFF